MEKCKNTEAFKTTFDEFGCEEITPIEPNAELMMEGNKVIHKLSVHCINQYGQATTENTISTIDLNWIIDAAVKEGCREQILQRLEETSELEEIVETEYIS